MNKSYLTLKSYYISKRIMDIFLSLIGIAFSLPILLIIGIAVKIDSKGPCFYCQKRVGLQGKVFTLYKIRSMYINFSQIPPQWTDKDDKRITRVGKFIRKTRIDELPQLINILKGEMSLVGPRPEQPYFVEKFDKTIPNFKDRLKVKCGLTGWAQVNGGYDLEPAKKLELDLYYINNQSLWLDIRIIFKTVIVVITGRGAR